ncbi:MAG TPA: type IX secretion system membrane protein PorP/SprF, partial [Bacteroidetes bacterium]|nr:type IX secretion system membrane protein PorP/SprF [Bacteroidota bacterium]
MKRFIYIMIFLLFMGFAYGQDMTFSQFYHNPSATNPALSVVFNGQQRAGTSIKRQWFTIEKSKYLSLTNAFYNYKFNIIKDDYLSLGGAFFDAGINGYNQTTGFLSIAYSKRLRYDKYSGKSQYLIYGIQAGVGKTYLNDGFIFGSQFDKIKEIPDIGLPSGEYLLDSKIFPDINMGLLWYSTGKNNSVYFGMGAHHINKPDVSLIQNNQSKLKTKYSILMGGEIDVMENINLLPSFYFNLQGPLYQFIAGANIRYEYEESDHNAFRIGIWSRLTNSIEKLTFSDMIFSSVLEF